MEHPKSWGHVLIGSAARGVMSFHGPSGNEPEIPGLACGLENGPSCADMAFVCDFVDALRPFMDEELGTASPLLRQGPLSRRLFLLAVGCLTVGASAASRMDLTAKPAHRRAMFCKKLA